MCAVVLGTGGLKVPSVSVLGRVVDMLAMLSVGRHTFALVLATGSLHQSVVPRLQSWRQLEQGGSVQRSACMRAKTTWCTEDAHA